jgi:hypothetical protein
VIAVVGAAIGYGLKAFLSRNEASRSAAASKAEMRQVRDWDTARWAAEMTVSSDEEHAALGVAHLEGLSSKWQSDAQLRDFVRITLETYLSTSMAAVGAGAAVQVTAATSAQSVGRP